MIWPLVRRSPKLAFTFSAVCLALLIFASQERVHAQVLQPLYSFSGLHGSYPQAVLVQASNGAFYGTTRFGGMGTDLGTVFKFMTNRMLTVLFEFKGGDTNGRHPQCGLVQANDGNLYGTTVGPAGILAGPVIFKVNPANDQFSKVTELVVSEQMFAPLIQARDGALYTEVSANAASGATNRGYVLKLSIPDGITTKLGNFYGTNGGSPMSRLVETADGSLYGTTSSGSPDFPANNFGTIFKMDINGTLSSSIVQFTRTNGARPLGGLVQATNGRLYGTTSEGGSNNLGTLFELTTNGVFRTVITFNGTNGSYPQCDLMQANDGYIYGVTLLGGGFDLGTLFRLSLDDQFDTLISFNGTNGARPVTGLMQAVDGHLYGTTQRGGLANLGSIYRLVLPSSDTIRLDALRQAENVVLRWPTNGAFTLEVATDLASPIGWTNFQEDPAVAGTNFEVTIPATNPSQFYRLKMP